MAVTWPADFVAPNGQHMGLPTLDAEPATPEEVEVPKSLAERFAIAEKESIRHRIAADAAERELALARALIADMKRGIETRDAQIEALPRAPGDVAALERRVAELTAELEKITKDRDTATRASKAQHTAEVDTLQARHRAEVESIHAEYSRQLTKLQADLLRGGAQ